MHFLDVMSGCGKEIETNHETNNLAYPTIQTGAKVRTYNTHHFLSFLKYELACQATEDHLREEEGCGIVLVDLKFRPVHRERIAAIDLTRRLESNFAMIESPPKAEITIVTMKSTSNRREYEYMQ